MCNRAVIRPGLAVLCIAAFAALLCAAAPRAFADEPARVLLPIAGPGLYSERAQQLRASTHLYMLERFSETRSVVVANNARTQALTKWLTGGTFDISNDKLFEQASKYFDVDLIARLRLTGFETPGADPDADKVELILIDANGVSVTPIPMFDDDGRYSVSAMVRKMSAVIADHLKLPAADRATILEQKIDDNGVFVLYYASRLAAGRWPANPHGAPLAHVISLRGNESWAYDVASLRVGRDYVASTSRYSDDAPQAATYARRGLVRALGTEFEPDGYGLAVLDDPALNMDQLEEMLLEIVKPLTRTAADDGTIGELEALEDMLGEGEPLPGGDDGMKAADVPTGVAALTGMKSFNREQQLGAMRTLAVMQSEEALPSIRKLRGSKDVAVRRAVVFALGRYPIEQTGKELEGFAAIDKDAGVRFLARFGRWLQDDKPLDIEGADAFVEGAARMLEQDSYAVQARDVIETLAVSASDDLLRKLAQSDDASQRRTARLVLAKRPALPADERLDLLRDPDPQVVVAAAQAVTDVSDADLLALLKQLANDPYVPVSRAAQTTLAPAAPKGSRRDTLAWWLDVEHPYLKCKAIDELAAAGDADAIKLIVQAAADANAVVRQHALATLVQTQPDRGLPMLRSALADPHRWVRLHASAMIAEHASPDDLDAITAARAATRDTVIRMYLDDASAKAQGKPLPTPRKGAHSIESATNLNWMCGVGPDAPNSPYEAYYVLGVKVDDDWRAAHDAGKILYGRAHPTGNPATLIVDPLAVDQVTLGFDAEMAEENLPYIDGIILGEESMGMDPDSIWGNAWRLFCLEVGIDPAAVDGKQDNLTEPQKQAWRHWSLARWTEGFNLLYDYTKLRYGKIQPGIGVCTYMVEQGLLKTGPNPADFDWKFDIGGIYHYFGCNRFNNYALIRRIRTIWPDRPVMWLSNGIGVYERTPVRYNMKVPSSPVKSRWRRTYMDSISSWLAGADTGYFSIWAFVDKDLKITDISSLRGVIVHLEDVYKDSKVLDNGIRHIFRGVEDMYRTAAQIEKQQGAEIGLSDTGDLDGFTLEEKTTDPHAERVKREMEAFRNGFLFFRKYLDDTSRLFSSLPRQREQPQALAIRPGLSVWSGIGGSAIVPGLGLLHQFDFLLDINKAAKLDLSRYRIIVVHDPGRLTDDTIAALTEYVRTQQGILYVHGNISHDNGFEASTSSDFDGKLANDWPWESAIAFEPTNAPPLKRGQKPKPVKLDANSGSVELSSGTVLATLKITRPDDVSVLARVDGKPVLAMWRGERNRGAVVFDGIGNTESTYLALVRDQLNAAYKTIGATPWLTEPSIHQLLESDSFTVDVASRYQRAGMTTLAHTGIDAMTGQVNPSVGPNDPGAVILHDYHGRYAAEYNGVTILCSKPIESIEPTEGGLKVRTAGLIEASSTTGKVKVSVDGGLPPSRADDLNNWILRETSPGIATAPVKDSGIDTTITYIRATREVTLTVE